MFAFYEIQLDEIIFNQRISSIFMKSRNYFRFKMHGERR